MADELVDEITFLSVPDIVVFGTPQPVIDRSLDFSTGSKWEKPCVWK